MSSGYPLYPSSLPIFSYFPLLRKGCDGLLHYSPILSLFSVWTERVGPGLGSGSGGARRRSRDFRTKGLRWLLGRGRDRDVSGKGQDGPADSVGSQFNLRKLR